MVVKKANSLPRAENPASCFQTGANPGTVDLHCDDNDPKKKKRDQNARFRWSYPLSEIHIFFCTVALYTLFL